MKTLDTYELAIFLAELRKLIKKHEVNENTLLVLLKNTEVVWNTSVQWEPPRQIKVVKNK